MALVENIQREDLDAIEIALTYHRLLEEIGLTQENLSQRVGKDKYHYQLNTTFKIESGYPERNQKRGDFCGTW